MNSLDDKKKLADQKVQVKQQETVKESTLETPLDAPLLYNDVVIDASELDQGQALNFNHKGDALDAGNIGSFNVHSLNEESADPASFSAAPAMHVEPKILEERQEPILGDGKQQEQVEHFAATDDEVIIEAEESEDEVAVVVPPKKQRKGSVLGMGWFQGFNLFICGIIFVGLAIFAYFIFGEKPLYTGKLPKYVVVENDELGSMGALNPAIPEEERRAYIYVPKIERVDDTNILQDRPILDTQDQETRITKVELQSGNDNTSEEAEVSIEMESGKEPAFTLLSVDHNADGIAREDLEMAEALIQQAEIAFMQGNYVGVEETDAYFLYQKALELDSKNRKAEQGLASIADIYYRSAYDAFTYGDQDIAKQYLMIGLKVAPNHRPLQELERRMEQQSSGQTMENFNYNDNGSTNDFGGFEFN